MDGVKTRSYHYVPCGKCFACRNRIQNDWLWRLQYEHEHCKQSLFITLTYDEEHVPFKMQEDGTFCLCANKKHVQDYLKRLRKHIPPQSLRYYIVSEYGETFGRPHYHGLLFNNSDIDIVPYIDKDWPFGFTRTDITCTERMLYVTGYVLKECPVPDGADPPWCLSSKNPAIGLGYMTEAQEDYHNGRPYLMHRNGRKQVMPVYYQRKFGFAKTETPRFDKEERQYIKMHPEAVYIGADGNQYLSNDFYIWRNARIKAKEENRARHKKKRIL
ncbi:replication initiator protein [Capybara microvirus Cap1_SP_217]|nr:replication initiator protein [Capybara microvirus Cap1_SP_217]